MLQKREPYGIGFDPEYTREELAEVLEIDATRLRKTLVEMAHRVLPRTREVMRQRSKTVKDPETGEKIRTTWKRSEEHTSELQSRPHLVCRLLLEKKKKNEYHQPHEQ